MKKISFILVTFLFIMHTFPIHAQMNTNSIDQKWFNHWFYNHLTESIAKEWFAYPQENFDPNASTTRAEFLSMLEKAIHLIPNSNSSKFLEQASSNKNVEDFIDTNTHWISTEGWLKTALNFGLIIPSDYDNNKFQPDVPITRRESMTMIIRALGRVHPSINYSKDQALFEDWGFIPYWAKGYANEMVNFKLLLGYPNGTVKTNNTTTKAEAVTMIDRAVKEMTQGIDSSIKVSLTNSSKDKIIPLDLPVPAQIINGKIYIPIRAIYDGGNILYSTQTTKYTWDPKTQILNFNYGVPFQFQGGNNYIGFYNTLLPNKGAFNDLAGEARILYGELMVPVINKGEPANLRYTANKIWDANTKNLIIEINYPQHPSS